MPLVTGVLRNTPSFCELFNVLAATGKKLLALYVVAWTRAWCLLTLTDAAPVLATPAGPDTITATNS